MFAVQKQRQLYRDHIYIAARHGRRKILKCVVSDGWNSTAIIQTRALSPRLKHLVAQVFAYVILP
jgi:hypothetical protein